MTSSVIDGTVVSEVEPDSPAWRMGLRAGDRELSVNGVTRRDIIEWQRLMSDQHLSIKVERNGERLDLTASVFGEQLGLSVESALFDRVKTCDNHCEFCFIYQLPKGMRRSLYLKDDDYRLSFLFGNFTTLTRFTEADLERVVEEQLSPLYVSVHAVDSEIRSDMLRNERGGMSLRWMDELLRAGIDIRAQVVLCPGINDGEILDSTLAGILERFPGVQSVGIVPLGLSRFNPETRMRVHTPDEARAVIARVALWQDRFERVLDRQPLFLADEFYLLAGHAIPEAEHYDGFPMLEDGIGLVRAFTDDFRRGVGSTPPKRAGFFAAFDAPNPSDYVKAANPAADTALRPGEVRVSIGRKDQGRTAPVVILTGAYAAPVISSLVLEAGYDNVEVRAVDNRFFGGNTGVAGLMTFEDVSRVMASVVEPRSFVIPDVCLNNGRFLDGGSVGDLRPLGTLDVIPSTGMALRSFLEARRGARS